MNKKLNERQKQAVCQGLVQAVSNIFCVCAVAAAMYLFALSHFADSWLYGHTLTTSVLCVILAGAGSAGLLAQASQPVPVRRIGDAGSALAMVVLGIDCLRTAALYLQSGAPVHEFQAISCLIAIVAGILAKEIAPGGPIFSEGGEEWEEADSQKEPKA